jgi:hypothetical protein
MLGTLTVETVAFTDQQNGNYKALAVAQYDDRLITVKSGSATPLTDPTGIILPRRTFGLNANDRLFWRTSAYTGLQVQILVTATNNVTDAQISSRISALSGLFTAGNILQMRSGTI